MGLQRFATYRILMAEDKTTTVISLTKPTPAWVNWIFRVEFVFNKAILLRLSSTTLVSTENIKELILALSVIDLAVWGLGRFIGEKKEDYEKI